MTSNEITATVRIENLDPATLQELIKTFPKLEEASVPEPQDQPVGEDRELGTIILAVNATIAGVNLITAVLNYLAARQHKGRAVVHDKGPTGKLMEIVVYDPYTASVHPLPWRNE